MDWSKVFNEVFIIGFLTASVRMAAPLLLASLGAIFTARVGIINLALEGIMLVGAFSGFYGAYLTGNPLVGALFGMAGGALTALILGFLAITVGANQTVAGTGINIFALGITSYLLSVAFGIGNRPSAVPSFKEIPIPVLADIPIIGPMLFNHIGLVYLAFLLVPVVWYILFRTPFGLTMRSVGEHPKAVDTLGGNVIRTRYICVIISGILAGLGGAVLSIGQLSVFMENITAGRGYIALAAVTFGKWNPLGVLGASMLFGAADGLQLRLQAVGLKIPYQFLLMLPYLLTMIALAGLVGKTTPPAAMGKPYSKQDAR
ncbi:ABC transporter permease [Zhaonella formicivorans]|uniref:ABC transporter permease n=1 Tax=Zhaonella formicivorans TaxID=2528593 RepID=UPI0010D07622|nr:ABC transporter permease [Zhaonella formicivorans]